METVHQKDQQKDIVERGLQIVEDYQFLVLLEEDSCLKVVAHFEVLFYSAIYQEFAVAIVVYQFQIIY